MKYLYFFLFCFLLSCATNKGIQNSFKNMGHQQIYKTGLLSSFQYDSLHYFMQKNNKPLSKTDTLIIKYHANGDECWKLLESNEGSNKIKQRIERNNEYYKNIIKYRPNTMFVKVKQSGDNYTKMVRLDNEFITDSFNILKNNLFEENYMCGTSAIILPNRKYILVQGDPHLEAINNFRYMELIR